MSDFNRSILELWTVLTSEPSMGRLLQIVVQTAEFFTKAAFGEIILSGESWTKLEYQFATEEEINMLRGLQGTLGARIIGVANRDSVKLELCKEGTDLNPIAAGRYKVSICNSFAAPLKLEGQVIGHLYLCNKTGDFTHDDQEFIYKFLEQVTLSLERELLRSRLGKMEHRLKGIFDAIADGILVINAEGKPQISNQAFRKLLFPENQYNAALGALLPSMINPDQDEGTQEIVLLKPHSEILSGHYVNLRDPSGRLREVIISLRNVTKAKEEERRFLQLITMIVHRLGNYLSDFRQKKTPNRRKLFSRVKSLVNNLVRLSEIKSGVLRIQRLPIEIDEVLTETLEKATKRLGRRQITLRAAPFENPLEESLWIDGDMMQEAFLLAFGFHFRNLKRKSVVRFHVAIDEKDLCFQFRTRKKRWKALPGNHLIDLEKCVDWFVEEENRPFLLDLPFAGHILLAHKGTMQFVEEGPEMVLEIRLSKDLTS